MRTLKIHDGRAERGAAALIVAVSVAVLCGAGAISVDYGRSSYDKRRVQNAADSAARAIALDCAKKLPCVQADANATARAFSNNNAGSDTTVSPPVLDLVNKTVTVTVSRNVKYAFAGAMPGGPSSGVVSSTAQASWGAVPVSGLPVLPFAVPLCSVTANKPATNAKDGPDHTYRTDLLNQVIEIADIVRADQSQVSGALNGLTGLVAQVLAILGIDVRGTLDKILNPLLASGSTDACGADANIAAAQGGFWLTSLQGALPGTFGGLFPNSGKSCQLRNLSLEPMVGQLVNGLRSSECFNLLGSAVGQIHEGDTVLVPVYETGSDPNANGLLGTSLSIDAGVQLLGTNTVALNVKVVGFVPFTITGWDNGRSGVNQNQTTYFDTQCNNIDLGTYVLGPALAPINALVKLLGDVVVQLDKQQGGLLGGLLDFLLGPLLNGIANTLNALLPGTGLGDLVKQLSLAQSNTTEGHINALTGIVSGLSADLGAISVGCQAVRGHFTRQTEVDPKFDWDKPPANYPAALLDLFVTVKLVK